MIEIKIEHEKLEQKLQEAADELIARGKLGERSEVMNLVVWRALMDKYFPLEDTGIVSIKSEEDRLRYSGLTLKEDREYDKRKALKKADRMKNDPEFRAEEERKQREFAELQAQIKNREQASEK